MKKKAKKQKVPTQCGNNKKLKAKIKKNTKKAKSSHLVWEQQKAKSRNEKKAKKGKKFSPGVETTKS